MKYSPLMLIVAVTLCFSAFSANVARNLWMIKSNMLLSGVVRGCCGCFPVGWIAGCARSVSVPCVGLRFVWLRSWFVRFLYCGMRFRSLSIVW